MSISSLSSPAAFRLVYRQGRRTTGGAISLYSRSNGLTLTRVGIAVGRAAGNAVRRNRMRRRVREALRLEQTHVRGGFDVVLVPRASARTVPLPALREELRHLLGQAGVFRSPDESP